MLGYDENGKLCEFEEATSISVCSSCHRIYWSIVNEQIPGFREREYDACPYCGYENTSSMNYEYFNSNISSSELQRLRKKSLYGTIIKFCHEKYKSSTCETCNHNVKCPGTTCGNCKQCLEEIHYPYKHVDGRKDYDCDRMINFYVCDYTSKYASEMLYLMRKSEELSNIENYHVLSMGCGACPDLMALEQFCHEISPDKTVSYIGIDVNERWKPIHEKLSAYKSQTIKKAQFAYNDVISDKINISDANVLVLQYIISHFYNTNQISRVNDFFDKLIEEIVRRKQESNPLVILINDVNSIYRGRDYFSDLVDKLESKNFHSNCQKFYFEHNIRNDAQRYGQQHNSCQTLFEIPSEFESIYEPWHFCSSAQLLIEVQ